MRMVGCAVLGTVILQLLLAAAFALGLFWLDGWQWGLLLAGVLLLLIALPWLGELKVVFDSEGPKGAVRVGWWGRASFRVTERETRVLARILGIPIRRTTGPGTEEAKCEEEPAPPATEAGVEEMPAAPAAEADVEEEAADTQAEKEARKAKAAKKRSRPWWRKVPDVDTIEGFCRIAGSALNASNELIWGAEEIRVSVRDPVQKAMPDAALEQVFGSRAVGPVHLIISSGEGERRVRAVYRIGLLRAALAAAQVAIDGRAISFARMMSKQDRKDPDLDRDQKMIEEIKAQQEAEQ